MEIKLLKQMVNIPVQFHLWQIYFSLVISKSLVIYSIHLLIKDLIQSFRYSVTTNSDPATDSYS